MHQSSRSPDVYFATLEDEQELAAAIWDHITEFYTRMRDRLYYLRAAESFRMYYGLSSGTDPFDVTQIAPGGDTGSHSLIKINHYYSLGQALVTMATTNKPDWVAVPENDDYESIQDKMLAQDLLDYYMREESIEMKIRQAVEAAVVMQDGYLLLTWNPSAGHEVTPEIPPNEETGDPGTAARYEGDLEARALTPFDVPSDLDWRGAGERPWVITRDFVNKWDLAEQFPEYRDEIIHTWVNRTAEGIEPSYMLGTTFSDGYRINRDQVAVFTFWHRKTKAVPQGKMVQVVNNRCCLFNGGLPYGDHLPLHRISPATMVGTTLGHTPMVNLIAVQKAISAAWSAPVTNLSLFGTGSLLIPKGSGLNITDLGGGAMGIEYDVLAGEPKPLIVPGIQQPAIEMAKELVRTAEVISGIAPVVRGNASPQLSGAAQALQMQTATQYVSGLIQGYTKLLESVGDALVKILQTYATTPKLALIVGKTKAPMLREFTGADISRVSRVTVQSGNALAKTPGGALAMADALLQQNKITTQEYFVIANGDTLHPTLTAATTQKALIRKENEMLSGARAATPEEVQQGLSAPIPQPDGTMLQVFGVPPALATDNHQWHEQEHPTVLDSPAVRANPFVIAATRYHLGQHKGFQGDPNGGIPAIPPPGSMPPPNMDPNPPPTPLPNPAANGGGPGPGGGAPPPAAKQQGPGGPAGPTMPKLPQPAQSPIAGQTPTG